MEKMIELSRPHWRIRTDPEVPATYIDLATFTQCLRLEINVDTLEAYDRNVSVTWQGIADKGSHERLSWTAKSTLWNKRYHLDVYAEHLEFHAEIQGEGPLDSIRFFDSIPESDHQPYSTRTMHLVDRGRTAAREYSTGSEVAFRRVFSPEPNYHGRREFEPFEYALVSVTGDTDYCGGNLIANPGLLCFAVAAEPDREWLAFGLAVEPGEYLFSDFEYLGGRDFAFAVNGWGARRLHGTFTTPRMVIVRGATAEQAVANYAGVLRSSGLVQEPRRDQPSWWSRPIVCGWGHQCYQADLFRVRSTPERPQDNAAYMLCTQTAYRDLIETLDAHDLPWGTLTIDARWFQAGGLKNVDVGRWPDLRGFIDRQHRLGRRVLLWWSPWDTEGIPAQQCITHVPDGSLGRPNRPGRRAKTPQGNIPLNALPPGTKLTVDATLPAVRERIVKQVRALLGREGLNADGLKIDHLSATPGSYGMAFPEGSGRLFGIEAAHAYLSLLYEAAKEVKPDALLSGQSPNPYLADVQDMVRISPWSVFPDSVATEARHSTAMARIADPGWLIDTNGYPMPSLTAFREYMELQPELGVPSLLYGTHLDTTGEAFTPDDYARIRRAWSRL
ncbi:TIM-barrel domain-containing protein [Streptosporangium sp. NPDC005286]|uniref:TIM-barrel domain-containing protein n=1 Tax=Streptosporangium sp. NPDC005286 TaxID=3154463 RepID=UPI0033A694A6